MLKFLTPKEDKYFEYFNDMIANVNEMAQLAKKIFTANKYEFETAAKIKSLERRCDEMAVKTIKKLDKSFITPFDREDILSLTKRIESVSDTLNAVITRLEIYNVTDIVESADTLSEIIALQIKELGVAINDLKERSKSLNESKIVKDLEEQADVVYREAIRKLFATEKDPIKLIKHKEILDLLERTVDKCQLVANTIITIFVKNS
ncbi:MAG: DUF47 family protein [Melioribacteraceae bacterium]|nr:DUF47 family protein [Melioribacteraceae bacterium]